MADIMDNILAAERDELEQRRRERTGLRPGGANPPPGWLATSMLPSGAPPLPGQRDVVPSANPLGGQEVSPLAVSGMPIPTGPASTTPGGQTITPVANPARPRTPGNIDLEDLGGQFRAINQLLGPAPQQPVVRDQIEGGGTIVHGGRNGLAGLYSAPDRVVSNPGDLANLASFNQQNASRGQDVGQLFNRLGTMSDQQRQLLHLTGPGGILQQGQAQIESLGLPRQQDAQNAAAMNAFITARVANGSTLNEALDEWRQSGMRVAGYAQPAPAGPPGAHPPIPAQAPTQGGTQTTPPVNSRMNQVYQTIQRTQSGVGPGQSAQARITDPNAGITSFVNTLGDEFINNNTPEVMRFIVDRFGPEAADRWFTNRSSVLGRQTGQEEAIQRIQRAANRVAPGVVGSSGVNPQTPGPIRLNPFAYD